MKNSSTKNAVSTPAIKIETKISANGAANVYVNGKRTSNEKAVKIAEANGLPTYRAVCYTYSQSNNSIDETLATALSAYKWLCAKGKSNRNVADGSWEIERLTDHKVIYEIDERDEEINADDEPEFANFIYAKSGAEYIKNRYDRMINYFNQLVKDGLTEEQAEQVITVFAENTGARKHCELIKEFKAANGIVEKVSKPDAGEDTKGEFGITVIGQNGVKVNVRPDCKIVALQRTLYIAGCALGVYDTQDEAEQAAENIKAAIQNGAGEYHVDGCEVKAEIEQAADTVANTVAEPDTEDYFELADELDEIGNDICDTKDILAQKIAGGAPQTEIKSLEGYIDEREDEYRTLHKRIYDVNPQSDITVDTEQAADTVTEPEVTATRLEFNSVNEALETWLSRYWPIDNYIHAEDDDGNEVEFTDADVAAIEKSLRGKYYIHRTGDGVEFFAEDCTASLLSAICTELEDRGCYIEDYHYAWREERELCEVPDEPPAPESSILEHMNSNAPEGWSVVRADDKIRVEYQGKHVADAEQFTKRELLAPHSFFQQFQPLVDKSKTPEQMFLDDRYRELAELEEMRKSPDCTPDARKKIDEMIERYKRDIAEAEFGARDTVTSFCKSGAIDEHGNIYF